MYTRNKIVRLISSVLDQSRSLSNFFRLLYILYRKNKLKQSHAPSLLYVLLTGNKAFIPREL